MTSLEVEARAGVADSGWLLSALLLGGSAVLALAVPAVVNLAFPVAAVALGVQLLSRGRVVALWELTVWLYLFTPLLRRLVDWRGGFHENSPVLLAAPAVALLGVLAVRSSRLLRPVLAATFLGAVLATVYGALVGLVSYPPVVVAVASLQWLSPLALGLLVLLGRHDADDLRDAVLRVTRWGLLLIGGYGLVQFFFLPEWDAQWMRDVSDVLGSIGAPEPFEVRVFSTSNSSGPLGGTLGVLLLLGLCCRRSWVDDLALALGLASFGLCQVRASWVVFAVALALLVLSGRVSALRVLGAGTAVVVLVLALGGPVADTIRERVDDTTSAGAQDTSLQARIAFQSEVLPQALAQPLGAGLGSTGTAVQRNTSGNGYADPDSGYVELLVVFGSPLGLVLLGTLVSGAVSCWRRALAVRGRDALFEVALAATVVTLPLGLVFGPAVTSIGGVFAWTALARGAGPLRDRT